MTSCEHFKQETPWDPFQGTLEEYPDIQNYVSHFQVDLKSPKVDLKSPKACQDPKIRRHYKDSIVVFKKKKLPIDAIYSESNIYNHDTKTLELDVLNENKSRFSCLRCRKFKKKCTRDLPECLNCMSSDELCIYIPRKRKSSVELSATVSPDKRHSVGAVPGIYNRSGRRSIDGIDKYLPFDTEESVMRRRSSMPIKLPTSRQPSEQRETNYDHRALNSNMSNTVNSSSNSSVNSRGPSRGNSISNLYKLLN